MYWIEFSPDSASENKMMEQRFIDRLLTLAGERDIPMSEEQARRCLTHVELLLGWNRKTNLTRITQPEDVLTRHIMDSILPAVWLPVRGWALDVGSGGGFPGIPLKIVSPGLGMVLLEAHRRKVSFLRFVLGRLAMGGLWAVQGRVENLEAVELPEGNRLFDLIVMRAVAFDATLSRSFARILRPGGQFAWWCTGEDGSTEGAVETGAAGSGHGLRFRHEFHYTLPGGGLGRRLMVWDREP